MRNWSTTNTWTWTPAAADAGTYRVFGYARNAGSQWIAESAPRAGLECPLFITRPLYESTRGAFEITRVVFETVPLLIWYDQFHFEIIRAGFESISPRLRNVRG